MAPVYGYGPFHHTPYSPHEHFSMRPLLTIPYSPHEHPIGVDIGCLGALPLFDYLRGCIKGRACGTCARTNSGTLHAGTVHVNGGDMVAGMQQCALDVQVVGVMRFGEWVWSH